MPAKTLVVRRGVSSQYYFYLSEFANKNAIDLIIDRRLVERRRTEFVPADDRRATDRRRNHPPPDPDADIVTLVDR